MVTRMERTEQMLDLDRRKNELLLAAVGEVVRSKWSEYCGEEMLGTLRAVRGEFNELRTFVQDSFTWIDGQVGKLELRMDKLERRMGSLEAQMTTLCRVVTDGYEDPSREPDPELARM